MTIKTRKREKTKDLYTATQTAGKGCFFLFGGEG